MVTLMLEINGLLCNLCRVITIRDYVITVWYQKVTCPEFVLMLVSSVQVVGVYG